MEGFVVITAGNADCSFKQTTERVKRALHVGDSAFLGFVANRDPWTKPGRASRPHGCNTHVHLLTLEASSGFIAAAESGAAPQSEKTLMLKPISGCGIWATTLFPQALSPLPALQWQ